MAVWKSLPGETPIDDISGLKIKAITTRRQLNVLEAENIRHVIVKYLSAKPSRRSARFDYSWSVRLHKEMFGRVWKWAGVLRTCDLNIGGPWRHIETRLYTLMGNLSSWQQGGMEFVEQAARLHHESVAIHPFLNGNGRWARMLANIWLKQHDHPPTAWPEETVGQVSRLRTHYLHAVRKADQGDIEPLLDLHRRFTPNS